MSHRKKPYTPLGRIVAEATAEHMSYGEYVAREEHYAYVSASKPNTPSKQVHINRTLLEGLDCELTHIDSRAKWLNDPEALKKLKEIRERRAKEHSAEQRVRAFFAAIDEGFRKRGKA